MFFTRANVGTKRVFNNKVTKEGNYATYIIFKCSLLLTFSVYRYYLLLGYFFYLEFFFYLRKRASLSAFRILFLSGILFLFAKKSFTFFKIILIGFKILRNVLQCFEGIFNLAYKKSKKNRYDSLGKYLWHHNPYICS